MAYDDILRDIRPAAPSGLRRIAPSRRIVPADVPEAAPVGADEGIEETKYWLSIQSVISADQATSTGLTATVEPWFYFSSLKEDPHGGGGQGGWVRGSFVQIPLENTAQQAGKILNWNVTIAERFTLRVIDIDGPGLAWLRIDTFGLVPRRIVDAIYVLGIGGGGA